MDIDFHFVQDRVIAKTIQVKFCSSQDQLANIFTKPSVDAKFSLKSSLGLVDTPLNSRGRINLHSEKANNTNTTQQRTPKHSLESF